MFFNALVRPNYITSKCDTEGKNKPCVFESNQFQKQVELILKIILAFLISQHTNAGTEPRVFHPIQLQNSRNFGRDLSEDVENVVFKKT